MPKGNSMTDKIEGVKTYFRSMCLPFLLYMFSCFGSVIHRVSYILYMHAHRRNILRLRINMFVHCEIQFYFTFFRAHAVSLRPSKLCPLKKKQQQQMKFYSGQQKTTKDAVNKQYHGTNWLSSVTQTFLKGNR